MSVPALLDEGGYEFSITPLKTGGRSDVHVVTHGDVEPSAFGETDIVGQLRVFFDKMDAEIEARKADPVAMVNALARMEALLADVRFVTNTARTRTAEVLDAAKIRRLTIDNVATVEGTSEASRTDWQDEKLLTDMLTCQIGDDFIQRDTGECRTTDVLASMVLEWVRVEWRLTPIRAAGLDPDDYSTQPKSEDGKALRTPTVRVHDNSMRKQKVV